MANYTFWGGVAPGSEKDVLTVGGGLNGHLKSVSIKSDKAVPGSTAVTTTASAMTVNSSNGTATTTLYSANSTAIPNKDISASSVVVTFSATPTFNGASGSDTTGNAVTTTAEYRKSITSLSGLSTVKLWKGQTPKSITITCKTGDTSGTVAFYANTINFTKTNGTTDTGITLSTNNASIASASSGTVTMSFGASTSTGDSTFKAQVKDGYQASTSATFNVYDPSIANVTVAVGGTATVNLSNNNGLTATWASSSSAVMSCTATANTSTTVTGVGAGTATLTATSTNTSDATAVATRTCTITVVAVSTITFHKDSSTTATITTANIGDTIYWKLNGDKTNTKTPTFAGCSSVSGNNEYGVIKITGASFSVTETVNGKSISCSGTGSNITLTLG